MSTTFKKMIFRDFDILGDGSVRLGFLNRKKTKGFTYYVNPESGNPIAEKLSKATLKGIISYSRKKIKRGHRLDWSLRKCIGQTMVCEIHDEIMEKKEYHRLQTVLCKMK